MYELNKLTEYCYYFESPAKIGLVCVNDTEVVLIDSGNDKDAGKKVKKALDANGWKLRAIYNTHSHADHIGGDQYLQKQTGCKVYAPELECDFTNNPILEPISLYGGNPPKSLKHKFLMAKESEAEVLSEDKLPEGFGIIELPGHSYNMVGYNTPDGVTYIADCLSSRATLEKYGIGYLVDPGAYIETLERVKELPGDMFVPAHADVLDKEELIDLCQLNIDKVKETADRICNIVKEPKSFDEILKKVFDTYGMEMTVEQHALIGSTVRSYLAWLEDAGRVDIILNDNTMSYIEHMVVL